MKKALANIYIYIYIYMAMISLNGISMLPNKKKIQNIFYSMN
jgi:hypothetical protein